MSANAQLSTIIVCEVCRSVEQPEMDPESVSPPHPSRSRYQPSAITIPTQHISNTSTSTGDEEEEEEEFDDGSGAVLSLEHLYLPSLPDPADVTRLPTGLRSISATTNHNSHRTYPWA